MSEPLSFPPARQPGLLVHFTLIAVLAGLLGFGIWQLTRVQVGPLFIVYLLLSLVAFAPLPLLAYRAYALQGANYSLDRDHLLLKWGLRLERLPLSDIEWIRPVSDLTAPLVLPALRLPGAVLGTRRHPDLGPIEFLADGSDRMLLVATARQVFAISPEDAGNFTRTFQRFIELGSLSPVPAQSQYPSLIVLQAWRDPLARYLWLAALFLDLGLLAWAGVTVPALQRIPLGFAPDGAPLGPFASIQLMLLPAMSTLFALLGWGGGLYFFRREMRLLARLVWVAAALTPLLFLVAMLFALTTPI